MGQEEKAVKEGERTEMDGRVMEHKNKGERREMGARKGKTDSCWVGWKERKKVTQEKRINANNKNK